MDFEIKYEDAYTRSSKSIGVEMSNLSFTINLPFDKDPIDKVNLFSVEHSEVTEWVSL
jgi:hypothetical protein